MNGLIGLCPQSRSLAEVVLRSLISQETAFSDVTTRSFQEATLRGTSSQGSDR